MKEVNEAKSAGSLNEDLNEELREATAELKEALEERGLVDGVSQPPRDAHLAGPATYYHLDGTLASPASRGLMLVVEKKADGTTVVKKQYIK